MVLLRFVLSVTATYLLHFLHGRLKRQSVQAVGHHSSVLVLGWHINCWCMDCTV